MRLRKLARGGKDAWEVFRDIGLGRYPDFVTGGPLARGDVPVFVFHSLEPESFGRQLRYLAEKGAAIDPLAQSIGALNTIIMVFTAHLRCTMPAYRTARPGMLIRPTSVAAVSCQALSPELSQCA